MFCTSCGIAMAAGDSFCSRCGKSASGQGPTPPPHAPPPKLSLDIANKKIAGVCSGLSRHFNIDVTILRVLFLAGLVLHGFGLVLYIILWIAMPRDHYPGFPTPATR